MATPFTSLLDFFVGYAVVHSEQVAQSFPLWRGIKGEDPYVNNQTLALTIQPITNNLYTELAEGNNHSTNIS
ncbi:MAG: hypothetical protein ABJG68_15135 [Crocinitomicaceae bacterium]